MWVNHLHVMLAFVMLGISLAGIGILGDGILALNVRRAAAGLGCCLIVASLATF